MLLSWCFTSTETIRLIRDGQMEVGEEGEGGIAFQAGFYGGWVGGGVCGCSDMPPPQPPR